VKISIVTISFNQARFLEDAIQSVLNQSYAELQYIVVDAGSTDGSREIIERYRDRIHTVVLEGDNGPADGLNKGFARATGELFGFLNSDDILLPGALATVSAAFAAAPIIDVLSGHAIVVDAYGREMNRFISRRFSPTRYVYGASVIAQQSTFFRATAFRRTRGFNVQNRLTWDGELWIDLALSGARFGRIGAFLSAFRVYPESISGSGTHVDAIRQDSERMFVKVKGRRSTPADRLLRLMHKAQEYILHPRVAVLRLLRGPLISNR
jgi:glycosyltransferase involved in cell wall biosynthesis